MKLLIYLMFVIIASFLFIDNSIASDGAWTMNPENFQQYMQREDNFNNQMFQIMSEEIKRRRDNPYYNCQFISKIEGNTVNEVKKIAVELGATHFQLEHVTKSSATGIAYKCP